MRAADPTRFVHDLTAIETNEPRQNEELTCASTCPRTQMPDRVVQRRCRIMPEPVQPPLHPGTKEPVGPDDLAPLFPMGAHRAGGDRPTRGSTSRARCSTSCGCGGRRHWCAPSGSSSALGTPARIYFKDESVSPAGSHKPNTAVPQAFYNKAEGITRLDDRDRRRPVGHRAVVRVHAVRHRLQGLHGACVVRAEAVPQDHDGDLGRRGRRRRRSTTRRTRARSASRSATPCATRRRATTRTTRSARCSTTCCCTRRSSASRRRSSSRSRARPGPTS